jgi:hypothetical protein
VIGLVIMTILFFVFFRKYKKTEQKLNYELSDVRNVASLRVDHVKLKEDDF